MSTTSHRHTYDTIIVGAGMAGLAAANTLQASYRKVLILEARDRVGGRIWSVRLWGIDLELGASWIHGVQNNPLTGIVAKENIKTVATVYASDTDFTKKLKAMVVCGDNGNFYSQQEIIGLIPLIKMFESFLQLPSNKNFSIDDVLQIFNKQHPLDPAQANLFRFLIVNLYVYEYAAELHQLSAHIDLAYQKSQATGANVIFPQGYTQVVAALAKNIPILLNHPVTKIHYTNVGVDVFVNQQVFHARTVIVTVPIGVLRAGKIKLNPALPVAKQQAINQSRMAVLDKVYLYFNYPFWDKDKEWLGFAPSTHSILRSLDIMNYYKFSHMPILLVSTVGDMAKGFERLSNQKIVTNIMQQLRIMYGNHIPEPSSYVITHWQADPYAHGSYSYLPRGVPLNIYSELAKPVAGSLFFAGEGTSETDPSTAHGAYLSGVRAAKEVSAILHINYADNLSFSLRNACLQRPGSCYSHSTQIS